MTYDILSCWHLLYFASAVGMSVFYGLCACKIFEVSSVDRATSWLVHQFWFNFAGSAVGWVAAWFLLGPVIACASEGCDNSISLSSVALFMLAFLGVTGHLPMSIYGLIGGLKEFVAKLLSAIGGKP